MHVLWLVTASVVALGALVLAAWLAMRVRDRYRSLLEAVELCQRQLTELRTAIDEESAVVAEVRALLGESVVPGIERLALARSLAQAAREVERGALAGRLDASGASSLVEQLERLEAEVLSGEHGD